MEQLANVTGVTWSIVRIVGWNHGQRQRLALQALAQDVAHAGVGVVGVVARTPAGGLGARDWEPLEMCDHGLHSAQLTEHVVTGEDLAHVRHDVASQPSGTIEPVALTAIAQGAALLG